MSDQHGCLYGMTFADFKLLRHVLDRYPDPN